MKYIDIDGTEKEISPEVEKKFAEQNKKWVPVEWSIIVIVGISVITGLWAIYEGLPKG